MQLCITLCSRKSSSGIFTFHIRRVARLSPPLYTARPLINNVFQTTNTLMRSILRCGCGGCRNFSSWHPPKRGTTNFMLFLAKHPTVGHPNTLNPPFSRRPAIGLGGAGCAPCVWPDSCHGGDFTTPTSFPCFPNLVSSSSSHHLFPFP